MKYRYVCYTDKDGNRDNDSHSLDSPLCVRIISFVQGIYAEVSSYALWIASVTCEKSMNSPGNCPEFEWVPPPATSSDEEYYDDEYYDDDSGAWDRLKIASLALIVVSVVLTTLR